MKKLNREALVWMAAIVMVLVGFLTLITGPQFAQARRLEQIIETRRDGSTFEETAERQDDANAEQSGNPRRSVRIDSTESMWDQLQATVARVGLDLKDMRRVDEPDVDGPCLEIEVNGTWPQIRKIVAVCEQQYGPESVRQFKARGSETAPQVWTAKFKVVGTSRD